MIKLMQKLLLLMLLCTNGVLLASAAMVLTDEKLEESTEKTNKYVCSICGKIFSGSTALKTHVMSHTGEKPFKCDFCDYAANTKRARDDHQRARHTDDKPFVCTVEGCGKAFARKQLLDLHAATHGDARPYVCSLPGCGQCFKTHSDKNRHERSHLGIKPHKCKQCDLSFQEIGGLRRHERTHLGLKNFACDLCDEKYTDASSLRRHISKEHGTDIIHACAICGERCASSKLLRAHEIVCRGPKPFACSICGRGFAAKVNMQSHEKTHAGKRDFECSICHAKFTSGASVKRHMKLHESGKAGLIARKPRILKGAGEQENFSCPKCASTFTCRSNVNRHMKNNHGMSKEEIAALYLKVPVQLLLDAAKDAIASAESSSAECSDSDDESSESDSSSSSEEEVRPAKKRQSVPASISVTRAKAMIVEDSSSSEDEAEAAAPVQRSESWGIPVMIPHAMPSSVPQSRSSINQRRRVLIDSSSDDESSFSESEPEKSDKSFHTCAVCNEKIDKAMLADHMQYHFGKRRPPQVVASKPKSMVKKRKVPLPVLSSSPELPEVVHIPQPATGATLSSDMHDEGAMGFDDYGAGDDRDVAVDEPIADDTAAHASIDATESWQQVQPIRNQRFDVALSVADIQVDGVVEPKQKEVATKKPTAAFDLVPVESVTIDPVVQPLMAAEPAQKQLPGYACGPIVPCIVAERHKPGRSIIWDDDSDEEMDMKECTGCRRMIPAFSFKAHVEACCQSRCAASQNKDSAFVAAAKRLRDDLPQEDFDQAIAPLNEVVVDGEVTSLEQCICCGKLVPLSEHKQHVVACLDQAPLRKTRRSATSIAPSTAHRVRRPVEETEVVEPTGPLKQAALLKAPVSVNQVPPVYQRSTSDDFVADSSLKDVFDKLFEEDDPALWVDYDSDNNKEW